MNKLKQLHQKDFNLWTEKVIDKIQERDFEDMDWDNLLDEIEDMGKSDKRALRSYTQRLIEHIFKLKYWQEEYDRNKNSWKLKIINFRTQISNILEDSPSLKNYLRENYSNWYEQSLKKYQKNDVFSVPLHKPVELKKIMDDSYFGQ
jgi:L-rhamnose isomerase